MTSPRRSVWRTALVLFLAVALSGVVAPVAAAQGTCTYNGSNGNCTVGTANNTYSISLTITAATRLQISTTAIALATATADEFMTGFGTPTSLGLIMRANTPWSLTIRSTATTWTGVGVDARPNRPVEDLQRATASGGPYSDMTTIAFSLFSGEPATAGTNLTLFFRARYQWLLDTPGAYTLPLELTISAP